MVASPCSCGEHKPHTIAERLTADGVRVCLWDDGAVTGALGYKLRDVPMRRPRTDEARQSARKAGRLLLGECCLWDAAELGELYAACVKAAAIDNMPGTVRRLVREARAKPVRLALRWVVTHTDARGTPIERTVRLPRLRWPGLHVFDFCGGPGSARGRYVLFEERMSSAPGVRSGLALYQTGFAFRTLTDLWAHLDQIGAHS